MGGLPGGNDIPPISSVVEPNRDIDYVIGGHDFSFYSGDSTERLRGLDHSRFGQQGQIGAREAKLTAQDFVVVFTN